VVSTELSQVHSRQVLEPYHPLKLTEKERLDALQYLKFLKEKQTSQIKSRGYADGCKKRLYMQKEETSAPTVALKSLFISDNLDTCERRDPGAIMQADLDGDVHMILEGNLLIYSQSLNLASTESTYAQ